MLRIRASSNGFRKVCRPRPVRPFAKVRYVLLIVLKRSNKDLCHLDQEPATEDMQALTAVVVKNGTDLAG